MAREVWYSIPEVCEESRYMLNLAGQVDITRPIEQESIAEQCAKDFWQKHCIWYRSWPLDVNLYASSDGELLAAVSVEMELEPMFIGLRKPNQ